MSEQQPECSQLPREGIFWQVVEDERIRSERYNHYFSVVLLRADRDMTVELFSKVQAHLRASDIVVMVLSDGRYIRGLEEEEQLRAAMGERDVPEAVGMVFPETDREGVKISLARLTELITSWGEAIVRVGYAVYPEDSTDALDLLSIASS